MIGSLHDTVYGVINIVIDVYKYSVHQSLGIIGKFPSKEPTVSVATLYRYAAE